MKLQYVIFYGVTIFLLIGILVYIFFDVNTQTPPVHVSALVTQNDIFFEAVRSDVESEIESKKANEDRKASESAAASELAENAVYNINEATMEELVSLKTIGEVTAQKILDYISQNGKLENIEELVIKKIVTKRQFDAIKGRIYT